MANLPWYGTAFAVGVSLYTTAGLITNPGTLTCKISKDFGNYADCHGAGPTEEDSTYGQIKVALDATDMTADHIDGYVIDDTSGCIAATFHIDTIPVVRGLAGTALPNAAADAAGGLPISDAGGLDLDTYIKRLEAAWTAALAARIDENISAAKTLTAAYDAAKTAAAAGAKMDLVDAPNSTAVTAIQNGLSTFDAGTDGVTLANGAHGGAAATITADITGDVTGNLSGSVGSVTGAVGSVSGDTKQTADVSTLITTVGAAGAGLTALGDTRLANLDTAVSTRAAAATALSNAVWTNAKAAYLDAAVSSASAPTVEQVRAEIDSNSTQLAALIAAVVTNAAGADVATDVIALKAVADAIKAITDTMTGAAVTVTSPVASSGTLTIYQGDDYATSEGRQISFSVADAGHVYGLDTAMVKLKLYQATWTGTATSTGTGYTVVFAPTDTQTAALTATSQQYELEATLANGHIVTLARGAVTLVKDIPVVV